MATCQSKSWVDSILVVNKHRIRCATSSDERSEENKMANCPTLREKIDASLKAAGVTEASAVHVTFTDGETILVVSENNPALNSTKSVAKIEPRTTAEAGLR